MTPEQLEKVVEAFGLALARSNERIEALSADVTELGAERDRLSERVRALETRADHAERRVDATRDTLRGVVNVVAPSPFDAKPLLPQKPIRPSARSSDELERAMAESYDRDRDQGGARFSVTGVHGFGKGVGP